MPAVEEQSGVGRRKTSTARVYLRPGNGSITINKKPLDDYFDLEFQRRNVLAPFKVTETTGEFNIVVTTRGGGLSGQAEAIRLGIARALVDLNEDYRKPLRDAGFLTRDPRMVERKKYGQPKARKKGQFSKR